MGEGGEVDDATIVASLGERGKVVRESGGQGRGAKGMTPELWRHWGDGGERGR